MPLLEAVYLALSGSPIQLSFYHYFKPVCWGFLRCKTTVTKPSIYLTRLRSGKGFLPPRVLYFQKPQTSLKNRGISVGLATGYGLEDRGVGLRVPVGSRIFTFPYRPKRLWGPPNLISNGDPRLFPRGLSGRCLKLTTHITSPEVEKTRIYASTPHTPSWINA
jgi:hypothetical protein